mgnify:FL=1
MKTQTLLGSADKFTSSEFTVLKSMALGLSCDEIRNLLGLKGDKYESLCQSRNKSHWLYSGSWRKIII